MAHQTHSAPTPIIHPTELKLKDYQGNLCNCIIQSFALCLYHIGRTKDAASIMMSVGDFTQSQQVYNMFHHIVVNACKPAMFIQNKQYNFEQDNNLSNMLILEGKGGVHDHTITIYKNIIFDSIHTNILFQCQQMLDWCYPPLRFHKIHHAYTLTTKKNTTKDQKFNHNMY